MDEETIRKPGVALEEGPYTMSIPRAGRLFYGLGKNASYAAADRGDIPSMRIGGKRLAVVSAIKRRFEQVA